MDMQDKVGNAQTEIFKQGDRALECDEDDARWAATLTKAAKQKPMAEKPE